MDALDALALNKEVEKFFFEAMLHGYVSGLKPLASINMPGCKEHSYRNGDSRLLDQWCVRSDSTSSTGRTIIWYKDAVVWTMNYGGYYEKEAIPVLRAALKHSYERSEFFGGRGPLRFELNGLVYENRRIGMNNFADFEGREQIHIFPPPGDRSKKVFMGFHRYDGMSLLNPPMP